MIRAHPGAAFPLAGAALALFVSIDPAAPFQGPGRPPAEKRLPENRGGAKKAVAPPSVLPPEKRQALQAFADAWFAARPSPLQDWDPALRAGLLERAKGLDPIPKEAVGEVRDLLWKSALRHGPALAKTRGAVETAKGTVDYVVRNGGPGRGLFLGLHDDPLGGGMNDAAGKWAPALTKANVVGVFPSALPPPPRATKADIDSWMRAIDERAVLAVLEAAKRSPDVDPDRVFVGGFGFGGTGAWFFAGRHAHHFAGALPFHGRIIAEMEGGSIKSLHHGLLPNLRWVPLHFTTGGRDTTFPPESSLEAVRVLEELRKEAGAGFEVDHAHLPDAGHELVPAEPAASAAWMASRRRATFPKEIRWELTLDPNPQEPGRLAPLDYYWLRCETPTDAMRIRAQVQTRTVNVVIERGDPKGLTVYLSPELLDVEQPVRVFVNGEKKWDGVLEPSFSAMVESMSARMDRSMVFDRRVDL